MKKQLKYNERNKVRVKPSKIYKKHYFLQKSNRFYDFFGQKVIIMVFINAEFRMKGSS